MTSRIVTYHNTQNQQGVIHRKELLMVCSALSVDCYNVGNIISISIIIYHEKQAG